MLIGIFKGKVVPMPKYSAMKKHPVLN